MTSPTPTTADQPIVGAYGDVFSAPVGTDPPTDLNDPGTPWIKMGLISEDGATWTPPAEETTDINAWQTPYPVRIVTTSLTTSIKFALMLWDRQTLPFALGGGSFEDAVDVVIYHPPGPGESNDVALYLKVLDDPIVMGIYYPKARVTDRGDATFKKDEAALLDLTFGIVGDVAYEPYQLLFGADSFPDTLSATQATATQATATQTPADTGTGSTPTDAGTSTTTPTDTGTSPTTPADTTTTTPSDTGTSTAPTATAGTPGTFEPAGVPPASLGDMGTVAASPADAWTTGQYVQLGDDSHAYWNGTAWTAGEAP